MIRLIEAKSYRCLRKVNCCINSFEILVGPNASGKSTFLDVMRFMGDLVSNGLEEAIEQRSSNLKDLFWQKEETSFELAVEIDIPNDKMSVLNDNKSDFKICRYELKIVINPNTQEPEISAEKVLFKESIGSRPKAQPSLFPHIDEIPETIMTSTKKGTKTIINKVPGGNDNYYAETGKKWNPVFNLGPRKSALANLPEDETNFPVSTYFKKLLLDGVQSLVLNSVTMRKPSRPGQPLKFRADGSNLPWAIMSFKEKNPADYRRWVQHIKTSLPDIEDINVIERPEDKHSYLQVDYTNNLRIPSWMLSDGTLRLIALTLIAYLDEPAIYLVEEPENGIHPQAIETVYRALSSAYTAQILCATHSPVILSLAESDQVLCFARTDDGATDIVRGSEHPILKDWQKGTDLGTLFAAGVLG